MLDVDDQRVEVLNRCDLEIADETENVVGIRVHGRVQLTVLEGVKTALIQSGSTHTIITKHCIFGLATLRQSGKRVEIIRKDPIRDLDKRGKCAVPSK